MIFGCCSVFHPTGKPIFFVVDTGHSFSPINAAREKYGRLSPENVFPQEWQVNEQFLLSTVDSDVDLQYINYSLFLCVRKVNFLHRHSAPAVVSLQIVNKTINAAMCQHEHWKTKWLQRLLLEKNGSTAATSNKLMLLALSTISTKVSRKLNFIFIYMPKPKEYGITPIDIV